MREDDYTGSQIDDDDDLSLIDSLSDDIDLDIEDEALAYSVEDDNEMVIHTGGVADGAKTLREAAELLYEFADELLAIAAEGWEIVDDINGGYGTAVRFDVDELAEQE